MRLPADMVTKFIQSTGLSAFEFSIWELAFHQQPGGMGLLARAANLSKYRIRTICARLVAAGWMQIVRRGRYSFPFATMPQPTQVRLAKDLIHDCRLARNKGEFLMKRLLDFYVASDRFIDNARPRFLTMPGHKVPLEYDRFYMDKFGFELNGPQHDHTTQYFPGQERLADQIQRDEFKARVSKEQGVELVIIKPDELMPDTFVRKIPAALKRRITAKGSYFDALLGECGSYHTWWLERGDSILTDAPPLDHVAESG